MKYVPPVGGADNDPYTDGNPSTGVEGSAVPAAAIEDPMRELVAVIVAAGLTPDDGQLNQVLLALQAMMPQFTDQTGSLGTNGWFSIPLKIGGVVRKFIVQWGQSTGESVTLNIQYPNAHYGVWPTDISGGGTIEYLGVNTKALNSFTVQSSQGAVGLFQWLSFGE